MKQLAIIGAGMAGLAAARALSRHTITITLYEKSRGVGGRNATRRVDRCLIDHGAQYLKTPTPELHHLVTTCRDATGAPAYDIGRPVWTFDADGRVTEGDPTQNAEPKWSWPCGVNTLARAMATGLDVRTGVQVQRIVHRASSPPYTLFDAMGQVVGQADAVLLTAPAPQTDAIITASALDQLLQDSLHVELTRARYRRILSVAIAYGCRPEVPWYALVNSDRQHPVSWLGCEHAKAGHAPAGVGLLIVQMAHEFTVAHWDEVAKGTYGEHGALLPTVLTQVHAHIQALVGSDLGAPIWANVQRWRYALPDSNADFGRLNHTESGLFFAGDYVAGQGRVHLAIESGWRVADVIGHYLSKGDT